MNVVAAVMEKCVYKCQFHGSLIEGANLKSGGRADNDLMERDIVELLFLFQVGLAWIGHA